MESRKMVQMNLCAGQEYRDRHSEWTQGEGEGGMNWESSTDTYTPAAAQSLRHGQLFETPWTAARQASLSITNSQSLPKLISIESVMPSNHLILCRPLLLLSSIFPSIRSLPMSQLFASGSQSIGVSASTSVLLMNTQD